ncbi:MAG: 50S ribosomal protein L29 [Cytophagales bacterium]|jgi:ribosomal protein L29|nr:50S ribosomal protein L29 [Cytophagales bacterium]
MVKNDDIDLSTFDSRGKILENIGSLKNELHNLRLKLSFENNEGGGKIRKMRKNIARLFTKLNSLK